jgi:hypothetical protein
MMIYQEKIAPPLPIPLTDDEKMKLTEAAASEDRWVKDFVDRLAGVVRDLKNWRRGPPQLTAYPALVLTLPGVVMRSLPSRWAM